MDPFKAIKVIRDFATVNQIGLGRADFPDFCLSAALHISSNYDTELSLTGERGITKSVPNKPSSQEALMEDYRRNVSENPGDMPKGKDLKRNSIEALAGKTI